MIHFYNNPQNYPCAPLLWVFCTVYVYVWPVLFACLVLHFCLVFALQCNVGHGGASCRGPAARGRSEASCGLYAGRQPSKIQNKQHKAHWMWCRCVYDKCMCIQWWPSKCQLFARFQFCIFCFESEPTKCESLTLFLSLSFLIPSLFCLFSLRRLRSFVWSGCRLMSSCDRSPRVTERLIGGREEHTTQTAVPMPPRPPSAGVAPTTAEVVGAEATTTILDMVAVFKQNRKSTCMLTKTLRTGCFCFFTSSLTFFVLFLYFNFFYFRHQLRAVKCLWDWFRA